MSIPDDLSPEHAMLHAWLDGELDAEQAAQLERKAQEDPEFRQHADALARLKGDLKQSNLATNTLPYADFFLTKLHQQIDAQEALQSSQTRSKAASGLRQPLWQQLLPWAISAACLVLLAIVQLSSIGASSSAPEQILSAYSPNAGVETGTLTSKNPTAFVVLTGLPSYEGDIAPASTQSKQSSRQQWQSDLQLAKNAASPLGRLAARQPAL